MRQAGRADGLSAIATVPLQAVLFLDDKARRLTILTPRGVALDEARPDWPLDRLCLDAVDQIERASMKQRTGPPSTAEQYYADHFVGIQQFADGVPADDWPDVYQGMQRRRLERAEFFRLAGRPDLADASDFRRVRFRGLLLGGLVAGGATFMTGLYLSLFSGCGPFEVQVSSYCDSKEVVRSRAGLALTAIGAAIAIPLSLGSLAYRKEVATNSEVRSIAGSYNQRLRQQLNLADPPQSRAPASGGFPLSLSLVPLASPSAGGLLLVGQF